MNKTSPIILISITGWKTKQWKSQLREINALHIPVVSLFLEQYYLKERKAIYKSLLNSCIKEIPLVHIRDDNTKQELNFLKQNYKTKYFTIHEHNFRHLQRWKGFLSSLYLEMNYDNHVPKNVNMNKIGGFCVDLSHFKVQETMNSDEYKYITKRNHSSRLFACNHLNGYSYRKNEDIHKPSRLSQFSYLKTLPKFVFGSVIALEMYNSIKEQLKFKKHIESLLKPFNP